MEIVSMKELLEAGVHFGHQTRKWNPKMKRYIYGERDGIYIIDLEKTIESFNQAYEFLHDLVAQGKKVLFVGTKKQAQETIFTEANRCGMFYVNHRWLGGTLTNFQTVRKSVERMKELVRMEEEGILEVRPKKEAMRLRRERAKLERTLQGIKDMDELPGALIIVDPHRERIAVREANKMGIPIVALVDTNCDPDLVNYCIPSNDDAIKAVQFLISKLTVAILEGKEKAAGIEKLEEEKEGEKAKESEPREEAKEKKTVSSEKGKKKEEVKK